MTYEYQAFTEQAAQAFASRLTKQTAEGWELVGTHYAVPNAAPHYVAIMRRGIAPPAPKLD